MQPRDQIRIEIDWQDARPFGVEINSFPLSRAANFQPLFTVGYGTFLIGAPVAATPPDASH